MGPSAWIPALALALSPTQTQQLPNQSPVAGRLPYKPNIVLIMVDDVGVDLIESYGESPNPACTPMIDTLASEGLLFRNAYTDPICSLSRAQVMTGRHGYRTGIGTVILADGSQSGLPLSETTLPQVLTDYTSICSGKWHLAHPTDPGHGLNHPGTMGFAFHTGSMYNFLNELPGATYENWLRTTDAVQTLETNYATSVNIDEAIFQANTLPEPWFLYVPLNAVHVPRHRPDEQLIQCPEDIAGRGAWVTRSMLEATDTEIGRMLMSIDPDAIVILTSDNGTGDIATLAPFNPQHGKGTVYEGGINVPLIIKGPGIVPGECDALVSSTDIFSTVAQLAGHSTRPEDSVSLVPYLLGNMTPIRTTVYAERFSPNGSAPPHQTRRRAIRNGRYKLIERTGQADEFYDLQADPFEANDLLLSVLSAEEQISYDRLKADMPTP